MVPLLAAMAVITLDSGSSYLGMSPDKHGIAIRVTRCVQVFDNKATTFDQAAKFKLIQDTYDLT